MRKAESPGGGTKMISNQKKRRILVADDDALFLEFMTNVLSHAGYDTITATSSEQALALITDERADFAMLDIVMPGMSGLELADLLRQQGSTVPFMFISALDDARTARRAAQ